VLAFATQSNAQRALITGHDICEACGNNLGDNKCPSCRKVCEYPEIRRKLDVEYVEALPADNQDGPLGSGVASQVDKLEAESKKLDSGRANINRIKSIAATIEHQLDTGTATTKNSQVSGLCSVPTTNWRTC
jgi:hypothetical protein